MLLTTVKCVRNGGCKIKKSSFAVFCVIFVILLAVVFCEGYFRPDADAASSGRIIELPVRAGCCGLKPVELDIQNQDAVRKSLPSGEMSTSIRYRFSVLNRSGNPLWIWVRNKGIDGTNRIESAHPSFDARTDRFNQALMPEKSFTIGIQLDTKLKENQKYLMTMGTIVFTDYKSGKELGQLPIKVINSKADNDCGSMCSSCMPGESCKECNSCPK